MSDYRITPEVISEITTEKNGKYGYTAGTRICLRRPG